MLHLHGQFIQSPLSGPQALRGLMISNRAGSFHEGSVVLPAPLVRCMDSMPFLGSRTLIDQELCACRASEP